MEIREMFQRLKHFKQKNSRRYDGYLPGCFYPKSTFDDENYLFFVVGRERVAFYSCQRLGRMSLEEFLDLCSLEERSELLFHLDVLSGPY